MQVLVFAPHPDDDVIGCGGSIAKHVAAGRAVDVVYLTSGNAGSITIDKDTLGGMRENEAAQAARHLGVRDLTFLRQDDGYLADTPALATTLIELIRKHRPDIAYVPHAQDRHPDHQTTHTLAVKAIGQASGPHFQGARGEPWAVPTVLAYEVWTPIQRVQYLEDVTDVVGRVRGALEFHQSQLELLDYQAMKDGLAQYRGSVLGPNRRAEAFEIVTAPSSSFTQ
ncbi:MAG: PIG-L family deacetylase [Mycobacteriaceae bacterium]|nr:PIG-L family deacetylase [Mycobacteriaceae bacterium]